MKEICCGELAGYVERDDGGRLVAIASCARCGAYLELNLREPPQNFPGVPAAVYPEAARAIAAAIVRRLAKKKDGPLHF